MSIVLSELAKISDRLGTPKKAQYGAPCNGCGLCCLAQLCPLGNFLFGTREGPCPALERLPTTFICGITRSPEKYAPARARSQGKERLRRAALFLIGAGVGCDCSAKDEPTDEAFSARLRTYASVHASENERAKRVWGVS